jgi:membrane-bound metal-dependent hydrolase YbcI (DUF457 family)
MNTLFHFLFNFIIIELVFGNASNYALPIFFASTLMDLDHIPYLFSKKKHILKDGLGERSRTLLHEMVGLLLISAIVLISFFFIKDSLMLKIIFTCIILHYTVDFIAGKTRPILPFSDIVLVSPIMPTNIKKKIIIEVILTMITGAACWILL